MFGREHGSKIGSGGVNSEVASKIDKRERLRQLALETIDLEKDPYFMKNHWGTFECRLCSTLHNNEGNYLAHTQGKRHQTNIARRQARENRDNMAPSISNIPKKPVIKKTPRIGMPKFRYLKQKDPLTDQFSLLFLVEYPDIDTSIEPRHRFASSFEQKIEMPDKNFQYIIFAADPYETIAFRIPNREIVKPGESPEGYWTFWDKEKKVYAVQFKFKEEEKA